MNERQLTDRPENLRTSDIAGYRTDDERLRYAEEENPEADPIQSLERYREATPLLPKASEEELRARWTAIQTGFVDEPSRSVREADELVAETMRQVAEVFAKERTDLEQQWDRKDDVSTEELRIALQRYRSFFDRLLSV